MTKSNYPHRREDATKKPPPRLITEALRERGNRFGRRVCEEFSVVFRSLNGKWCRKNWNEFYLVPGPDGTDRVFRWRRREHIATTIRVYGVLIRRCDFTSMRVRHAPNGDRGIGVQAIAAEAGCTRRSAERALQTLRRTGIIARTEQRRRQSKLPCGAWGERSAPAMRILSPQLFRKLGPAVWKAYRKAQRKGEGRHERPPEASGHAIDLRIPGAVQMARKSTPIAFGEGERVSMRADIASLLASLRP